MIISEFGQGSEAVTMRLQVRRDNQGESERLDVERPSLLALPARRTTDYEEKLITSLRVRSVIHLSCKPITSSLEEGPWRKDHDCARAAKMGNRTRQRCTA
jgi:hypothetical protein